MRFWWIGFLGALLLAPLAAWSAAAPASTPAPASSPAKNAPPWDVRPVFDPAGAFAFCLMDHAEADGKKMTVALNPANEINFGFTIAKAGLKPGGLYDIAIAFSNGWTRTIRGEALNPETVLLHLGTEAEAPRALTASTQLTLAAASGGGKVVFPLPAITPAFATLHNCLDQNRGKLDKNAASVLLPTGLQKLLTLAGLAQAEPLSLVDIPPADRPADYMWKIGAVIGGARQRDVPADKSLDEFVGLHLAALKEKCGASFTAQTGKDQRLLDLTLTTADATCARADHPVFLAVLYYLSAAHQLSIITHEGPPDARTAALAARDSLVRAIGSLAAEAATQPAASGMQNAKTH